MKAPLMFLAASLSPRAAAFILIAGHVAHADSLQGSAHCKTAGRQSIIDLGHALGAIDVRGITINLLSNHAWHSHRLTADKLDTCSYLGLLTKPLIPLIQLSMFTTSFSSARA